MQGNQYLNRCNVHWLLFVILFLAGAKKPKSRRVTTSSPLSPELLSATAVTAPVSSVHHHHFSDVTGQDEDTLKRKKRKAKKQKDEVFFCNFPNHEGLVSRIQICNPGDICNFSLQV